RRCGVAARRGLPRRRTERLGLGRRAAADPGALGGTEPPYQCRGLLGLALGVEQGDEAQRSIAVARARRQYLAVEALGRRAVPAFRLDLGEHQLGGPVLGALLGEEAHKDRAGAPVAAGGTRRLRLLHPGPERGTVEGGRPFGGARGRSLDR